MESCGRGAVGEGWDVLLHAEEGEISASGNSQKFLKRAEGGEGWLSGPEGLIRSGLGSRIVVKDPRRGPHLRGGEKNSVAEAKRRREGAPSSW